MKLQVHNQIMLIYIQYKFHEIQYVASYGRGQEKSLKFRQTKGNNSSITNNTIIKLCIHNHTMAIYKQ